MRLILSNILPHVKWQPSRVLRIVVYFQRVTLKSIRQLLLELLFNLLVGELLCRCQFLLRNIDGWDHVSIFETLHRFWEHTEHRDALVISGQAFDVALVPLELVMLDGSLTAKLLNFGSAIAVFFRCSGFLELAGDLLHTVGLAGLLTVCVLAQCDLSADAFDDEINLLIFFGYHNFAF